MAFYKVCGNYYGTDNDANSLKHYRTPGSKNGVRKYQYEDGTLTPAGKIHYGVGKGGGAARGYTDTGTGQGPTGLGRLAYKVGGTQGYANYRKAASNVNKAAGNVSRWAGQAGRDANKWGSQAIDDVKRFAGVGTKQVADDSRLRSNEMRDRLTAENAKRIQDNDLINKQRADKQFGPSQSYADQFNENTRINYVNNQRQMAEAGREARAAEEAHANSIAGRAERAYNDASKAVDDAKKWTEQAAKDAGKAVDDAKTWVGERASDVKKWSDQAGKDIGKAASDVKTWGEQAAKDVGTAAKNAGDWVGDRARDVGNAVGKAAKDVGDWGKGAVDKGRDFITGLFGKKKKG